MTYSRPTRMPVAPRKKSLSYRVSNAAQAFGLGVLLVVIFAVIIVLAFGLLVVAVFVLAHNIIEVTQHGWDFWRLFWIILSGVYLLVLIFNKKTINKSS